MARARAKNATASIEWITILETKNKEIAGKKAMERDADKSEQKNAHKKRVR